MVTRETNEGLRKHRPRKTFRFEYIRGKYSGMTAEQRRWRAFDEMEKEEDGYLDLLDRWSQYKEDDSRGGVAEH
jgi:hypothetical protein